MDSGARWWFAVLALGSMAFTLFGSLVPFEFEFVSWPDAFESFAWAMSHRLAIESRSDAVANVMLGVPLGFGLLGAIAADRKVPLWLSGLYGLALLPACCAFAAGVEFSQLFVPVRTCAGSDVLAQTIGSAFGIGVWLAWGQWLTDQVRKATTGSGAAGRFLVGYVLLLGFIQALPFDLTLSPANAYRKFRDGKVRLIPFGEFQHFSNEERWERIATLIKLAGLYLPAGLIAGCLPMPLRSTDRVRLLASGAIALPVGIEAAQVLVESRTSSATDAAVGSFALALGWLLARPPRIVGTGTWSFALVWFALMATVSWQPFGFRGPTQPFDWVLGMPLEGGNALTALEEMLTKLVLFGIGGAVAARWLSIDAVDSGWTIACAGAFGLLSSAIFEIGQTRMPNHTPCITDVFLGGMGGFVGAWVRGRVLHVAGGTSR